ASMLDHITRGRKTDGRRALGMAALSVALHLGIVALLLLLASGQGKALFADEGAGDGRDAGPAGGGGGGGGGEQVTFYEIPPPPPAPLPPPPPEEEVLVPPVPEPPPAPVQPPPEQRPETPARTPATGPGTGGGTSAGAGAGQGPGTGPGTGPGSGGGSGGGTGGGVGSGTGPGSGAGRATPPGWDFMIIPPARPRGMAARDVEIRVLVDERGRVKDVDLVPPTGNRGYDEQLRRMARDWRFTPARDASNRPIEAWVPVTITI
ncbi:MAG TPA: energy transducer TonB, partial [Longimicrobiaceae bacterium]|nr:energy transducer TonB [Longimicrobiaceae bacterium]